jgi:hypothetical protein
MIWPRQQNGIFSFFSQNVPKEKLHDHVNKKTSAPFDNVIQKCLEYQDYFHSKWINIE